MFRFLGTAQRHRQLGLHFVPFSGPSSPGDQVLGECTLLRFGASYHLPHPSGLVSWVHCLRCAMCLFWGADFWLLPSKRMSPVQDPRKAWLATGSLVTVWWIRLWGLVCPFLALAAFCLPPCLPASSGGWAGLLLASSLLVFAQSFVLWAGLAVP